MFGIAGKLKLYMERMVLLKYLKILLDTNLKIILF